MATLVSVVSTLESLVNSFGRSVSDEGTRGYLYLVDNLFPSSFLFHVSPHSICYLPSLSRQCPDDLQPKQVAAPRIKDTLWLSNGHHLFPIPSWSLFTILPASVSASSITV